MTDKKTLTAIQGTDYEVNVIRDSDGGYTVTVYKPAATDDPWVTQETVDMFFMENTADIDTLNKRVSESINKDKPSLVGYYRGVVDGN